MNDEGFERWASSQGLAANTIKSRISNIHRLEKVYGNLDHLSSKEIENLSTLLYYTKEDDAKNRPVQHLIHISGNKYNGTATLRNALSIYINFRAAFLAYNAAPSSIESNKITPNKHISTYVNNSSCNNNLTHKIAGVFNANSRLIQELFPKTSKETIPEKLQPFILSILRKNFSNIIWGEEVFINAKTSRDKADIVGVESPAYIDTREVDINKAIENVRTGKWAKSTIIILEFDTFRGDQTDKKFVSRIATFVDYSLIYIVGLYPQISKSHKCINGSLRNHLGYCKKISNRLNITDSSIDFEVFDFTTGQLVDLYI